MNMFITVFRRSAPYSLTNNVLTIGEKMNE